MKRKFNKELFSLIVIERTIEVFKSLACISFVELDMYWEVCFENCKFSIDKTVNEFGNYLIQLAFLESKKVV